MVKNPNGLSIITVTVQNSDSISIKEEAKKELIAHYKNLQQQFVNETCKTPAQGMNTGLETEEVDLPGHIAEQFEVSYVDNRAIKGQNAIKLYYATTRSV